MRGPFLGVPLLVLGYLIYASVAPQWHQAQTWWGQLSSAFSAEARQQIQVLQM